MLFAMTDLVSGLRFRLQIRRDETVINRVGDERE